MKKLLLKAVAVVIGLTVFTSYSYSQVQIGLHGSRLEGTGSSQWGFGGNIKFLVADKFAIGVAARGYPKNMKSENFDYGGNNYKMLHGNSIVPVSCFFLYQYPCFGINIFICNIFTRYPFLCYTICITGQPVQ